MHATIYLKFGNNTRESIKWRKILANQFVFQFVLVRDLHAALL